MEYRKERWGGWKRISRRLTGRKVFVGIERRLLGFFFRQPSQVGLEKFIGRATGCSVRPKRWLAAHVPYLITPPPDGQCQGPRCFERACKSRGICKQNSLANAEKSGRQHGVRTILLTARAAHLSRVRRAGSLTTWENTRGEYSMRGRWPLCMWSSILLYWDTTPRKRQCETYLPKWSLSKPALLYFGRDDYIILNNLSLLLLALIALLSFLLNCTSSAVRSRPG